MNDAICLVSEATQLHTGTKYTTSIARVFHAAGSSQMQRTSELGKRDEERKEEHGIFLLTQINTWHLFLWSIYCKLSGKMFYNEHFGTLFFFRQFVFRHQLQRY